MNARMPVAVAVSLLLHAILLLGWQQAGAEAEIGDQLPPGAGEGIESAAAAATESSAGAAIYLAAGDISGPAAPSAQAGGGDSYLGTVRSLLARRARAFSPRATGVAEVRFAIAGDGAVQNVALALSSGNAALDAAALRLVRESSPLPAPPQAMRLRVPVEFR